MVTSPILLIIYALLVKDLALNAQEQLLLVLLVPLDLSYKMETVNLLVQLAIIQFFRPALLVILLVLNVMEEVPILALLVLIVNSYNITLEVQQLEFVCPNV